MRTGRAFTAVLPLLGALSACGSGAADGGIAAFAHQEVQVQAVDQPKLNGPGFYRELDFSFASTLPESRATCASFRGATATFAGRAIEISSPGGWAVHTLPTNTKPGETVTSEGCERPFIFLEFPSTDGEPQNGILAIDGSGAHLEVTFHRDFGGSPTIDLVTIAADKLVFALRGFSSLPALADVRASASVLTPPGGEMTVVLPATSLAADGQLELALPRPLVGPLSFSLTVDLTLGRDDLPCEGFLRCSALSRLYRHFDVDLPVPAP